MDLLNLTAGIEMLDDADESTVTAVFEKYFTYFDLTGEVCYPIYSGSDKGVKNQTAVKAMAVKKTLSEKDLTDLKAVKKYFNENLLFGGNIKHCKPRRNYDAHRKLQDGNSVLARRLQFDRQRQKRRLIFRDLKEVTRLCQRLRAI
ncbi:MAG: hypothetical protein L6V93_13180 [Clostridiales bacterium]|nr:MAG: hypothetical protein L6V93_13180 [Clostridiales bacterium]